MERPLGHTPCGPLPLVKHRRRAAGTARGSTWRVVRATEGIALAEGRGQELQREWPNKYQRKAPSFRDLGKNHEHFLSSPLLLAFIYLLITFLQVVLGCLPC